MSATSGAVQPKGNSKVRQGVIRRMSQVVGYMVVLGVILFVASGQLDWVWAWVYLGLSTATVAFFSVVLLPGHSDLVAERAEAGPGTKGWDRLLTLILLPVGLAMYIVAGLDQRFGWTGDMPLAAHIVAAVFVLLGYALTYWAMLANHFFATTVRIQSERGHTVVDSGPYRFVRHPGYVGILVYSLAALVLLGSLWALIPGALDVVLYVIRTSLEDKTLQAELPGYKEYAARTRYRLIPGLY